MKEKILESNALLLSSNSEYINSFGNEIEFKVDGVDEIKSFKYFTNIFDIFKGKTNYYGCAMVFKSELKKYILPVPNYVESHDLWIAMAANLLKLNLHLNEPTIKRRIHGNNASVLKRNFFLKLKSRLIFIRSIIELKLRIFKKLTL
jgi:hypothetical protein